MVKYMDETLDTVFSALADPTRRGILERLRQGKATVTEVAEPFAKAMSLPAISKHVRILENAGLIVRQKEGREHHLRLAGGPLKDAADWMGEYRRFWEGQFDSLTRYFEESGAEDADEQRG